MTTRKSGNDQQFHTQSTAQQADNPNQDSGNSPPSTSPKTTISQSAPAPPTPDTPLVEIPAAQRPTIPTTSKVAPAPVTTAKAKGATVSTQRTNGKTPKTKKQKPAPKPTVQSVVPEAPKFARIPLEASEIRAEKWRKIEETLRKYFYKPEITVAKVVLATAASQVLKDFPPCWLMVIAPPGSTKTAMLKSLDGLPRFHLVDTMTENTFLSGKIDDKNKARHEPASLLHRWGSDAVMICADFSSYLSLDKNRFAAILGQMRRIYDGHLTKETGSDENAKEREWRGRLTVIAGCTAEIDRQYKVFQSLGDRFARTRAARFGGADAAIAAMNQKIINEEELKKAVHAFMLPVVSWPELPAPTIPEDLQRRLANLTELLAQTRSYVPRDYHDREITGFVETESNTRIAQEIAQIMRAWALLMGRNEVNEEDFALAKRAAWDSIPPVRMAVLKALIQKQQPKDALPELPPTTVDRAADDLVAIGLADKEELENDNDGESDGKFKKQSLFSLSRDGRTLIEAIKSDGPEGVNTQAAAAYDRLEPSVLGGADVRLGEAKKARLEAAKKLVQPVRPVHDPAKTITAQPVREVYDPSKAVP